MKRTILALAAGLMAGGAWAGACCGWMPQQKAASPSTKTEAALTAGGPVDAAYAAEPASGMPMKKTKKMKKAKAAAAGYECPQCHMASDKPGDCPMCKVALVPKPVTPKKQP